MEKTLLNCAVVDDSTLQRLSIVKLIENHKSLNLVAQYNNAIEAKEGIATSDIDLIFLDIEMPILSGFDLLYDLIEKPQIIHIKLSVIQVNSLSVKTNKYYHEI